jgi:membrane-anchored protein YejM (alkaline phosphatase superfamily)
MFVFSGYDKIIHFNDKVKSLNNKLLKYIKLPDSLLKIGMILVILLEIIGPIIILSRIILGKNSPNILKIFSNITFICYILFLIVVTFIYHPPNDKTIPFLSNCTTLAGIILMFIVSNSEIIN